MNWVITRSNAPRGRKRAIGLVCRKQGNGLPLPLTLPAATGGNTLFCSVNIFVLYLSGVNIGHVVISTVLLLNVWRMFRSTSQSSAASENEHLALCDLPSCDPKFKQCYSYLCWLSSDKWCWRMPGML